MASPVETELNRLNAEMVGYLLTQRSPPRDLVARRDMLRATAQRARGPSVFAGRPIAPRLSA